MSLNINVNAQYLRSLRHIMADRDIRYYLNGVAPGETIKAIKRSATLPDHHHERCTITLCLCAHARL
jgi:hypothetical protein